MATTSPPTHILALADRILATVEGGALPYEISGELSTVGPYDFAGVLPAGFAAHTKTDPQKGEVHAIAYSYRQDYVHHIVIDKTGKNEPHNRDCGSRQTDHA